MLVISLFGTTAAAVPGSTVDAHAFGGAKPRQILEILALAGGAPVAKEHLADLLWDGRPPKSWVGTLESYVCVLRRRLGAEGGRRSPLSTVLHGYVLDLSEIEVDLVEFRRLVAASRRTTDPAAALAFLLQALDLAGGELLASEAYATWAIREREVFGRELVTACTAAAELATVVGDHAAAERTARRALAHDDLAEGAWRLLMQALWADGRRGEALRVYDELRRHLSTELGTDPSRGTTELYLRILREEPARRGAESDAAEEVRALLQVLRTAFTAVPGLDPVRGQRALALVDAELARAS